MCRSARGYFFSAQIKNRDFAGPDTDHGLISVAPAARLDIGAVDAAVAGRQIPLNVIQHRARFQIIVILHIGGLMRGGIAMVKRNRTRLEPEPRQADARRASSQFSGSHTNSVLLLRLDRRSGSRIVTEPSFCTASS